MKPFLILRGHIYMLFLFVSPILLAQENQQSLVSIQKNITYTLASSISLTGKSRVVLPITLPENTIAWFYQISATKGSENPLNLLLQLSRLTDPTGLTADITSKILTPKGDVNCNVFVLNQEFKDAFLAGKQFSYSLEGSVTSIQQATMQLSKYPYGTYYIGLDNPNINSIIISIEVAAFVINSPKKYASQKEFRLDWQGQNSLTLINIIKSRMNLNIAIDQGKLIGNDSVLKDLKECVINKIIDEHKYIDFLKYLTYKQNQIIQEKYKSCVPEFYYHPTQEQQKAITYGNLAWQYYLKGDLNKSIEFTEKSLQIAPFLFTKANAALFNLLQGNESKALEDYIDFISFIPISMEPVTDKKQSIKGALEDLKNIKKVILN